LACGECHEHHLHKVLSDLLGRQPLEQRSRCCSSSLIYCWIGVHTILTAAALCIISVSMRTLLLLAALLLLARPKAWRHEGCCCCHCCRIEPLHWPRHRTKRHRHLAALLLPLTPVLLLMPAPWLLLLAVVVSSIREASHATSAAAPAAAPATPSTSLQEVLLPRR
jgi:hypothetical protein